MVERSWTPPMEKWEISFVWRSPHSWPGMAFWEVREARHWVTLDGGSWWFQAVGRELCRRGQYGVFTLSWGSRDSLWQDLSFVFFLGEGSEGAGHRRVNVQKWRLVKLYCPDTFSHICKTSRGHYVWPKKTLTLNVSTPVCGKRSFLHKRCACVSISRHACVFFFFGWGSPFTGGWLWIQTDSR